MHCAGEDGGGCEVQEHVLRCATPPRGCPPKRVLGIHEVYTYGRVYTLDRESVVKGLMDDFTFRERRNCMRGTSETRRLGALPYGHTRFSWQRAHADAVPPGHTPFSWGCPAGDGDANPFSGASPAEPAVQPSAAAPAAAEPSAVGGAAAGTGRAAPSRITAATGIEVQRLRWKLDLVLQALPPLPLEELLDDGQATKTSRRRPGQVGGKHWQQEVSIVGHLARIGGLSDPTTVAVELGAGTARLSERLQQMTGARFSHVLVDRQQFKGRACSDHAMRKRASPSGQPSDAPPDAVVRLVKDIAAFDFAADRRQLCISKHLCGPACDLAVEALRRAPPHRRPPCCLATCCHYLCRWDDFSGRPFWEACGLDEEEFRAAVATSQWACMQPEPEPCAAPNQEAAPQESQWTCMLPKLDVSDGTAALPVATMLASAEATASTKATASAEAAALAKAAASSVGMQGDASLPNLGAISEPSRWLPDLFELARSARMRLISGPPPPAFMDSAEFERTFPRKEKIRLGRHVKCMLDYSRAAALQRELGYSVRLVRYTTRSVEDRLLVACSAAQDHNEGQEET